MMAVLRHWTEFLVNPYFLCLFFLGLSLYFLWRRTHLGFVRITLTVVFMVLLIISTGWLPRYMTYKLEEQYPVVQHVDPQVKWVVVLSGGSGQSAGMPVNDLLTATSLKRLIEGIRLFRALPQAQLVLSGGGDTGEQPEAERLAQLAKWFSIPEQRVVLEGKSINTADQARELVAIVHDQPFYLITSAIHMSRSMALCQQQGLHPIPAPTDFTFYWTTDSWGKMIIPNAYNLSYFAIAMHEVLGKIWANSTLAVGTQL
ncbi:YdcF family protein [Legionella fallonii]|uniref:DUF218 domain-containing protein n=1 Tax=Legionella fallonii LLAP-10 TaxID=1212491 RepID=A0A098G7K1_9GAMM|nr:ElyC/SanA/YdcF family protein [Legionella fallonii]CEG57944.1 conserved protein of unknown function [Legionella fallonii LLAP-10]